MVVLDSFLPLLDVDDVVVDVVVLDGPFPFPLLPRSSINAGTGRYTVLAATSSERKARTHVKAESRRDMPTTKGYVALC